MNKTVSSRIKTKNEQGQLAFIPFVVAGDPDEETCKKVLIGLQNAGADVIELGIPYSDPLADGPVIQLAAKRALKAGASLKKSIQMIDSLKEKLKVPVVIFTYYNPVLSYGLENFIKDVKKAGFSGILVPDLPVEEAEDLIRLTEDNDLELIMLVTPTSGDDRIKKITGVSRGFIYLVSITGVTGARSSFSEHIEASLSKLKQYTDKPVCVGFGISKPEHIDQLKQLKASGAIVGSGIIKIIEENLNDPDIIVSEVETYVKSLIDHC
jgi:tryptophan synthase alpha chain